MFLSEEYKQSSFELQQFRLFFLLKGECSAGEDQCSAGEDQCSAGRLWQNVTANHKWRLHSSAEHSTGCEV